MKREFSSKLKELLNSSITPPQNPVQHYQRLAKSPFDDYSRPSLNNTNKSSSVFGLDYSSPLRTVSKVKDDNNNEDNDFFNELTKQCSKYQGKDSNVSTSRNTIMYKHNERNNKNNNNNNKYTYEELKQLHQTASKLNKKGANDIHNLNNDSNFIINKKLFHIANTPTSNRRNIVLFGENYKCNGNNNNNKIENRKTRLMSPPPVSLKYDLNKNISNVNQQHRMKYGTFLIHELNPKNKDRKRINKWINEMQDNGKGKNNNNNKIYMNTEKNDLTNKNIETLLFKKETKTYKFKGDKRMEAFMKEFDIDSSAFKNITKRHNNI